MTDELWDRIYAALLVKESEMDALEERLIKKSADMIQAGLTPDSQVLQGQTLRNQGFHHAVTQLLLLHDTICSEELDRMHLAAALAAQAANTPDAGRKHEGIDQTSEGWT
jgi:hypothetical protein